MARAGLSQRQESVTQYSSPTWVEGTHLYEPLLVTVTVYNIRKLELGTSAGCGTQPPSNTSLSALAARLDGENGRKYKHDSFHFFFIQLQNFEFIHSFYLIVLEIFFLLEKTKQKGEVYNLPMPLNLQSSKLNIEMFL